MTEEEKARLKALKEKGELSEDEKKELAELNTKSTGKTFTQEEVTGLITKKTREAEEKLLKKLGVDNFDTAKEGLAKLKEIQDKDKTELQKLQDQIEELKNKAPENDKVSKDKDIQIAILKAGVPSDKVEQYTRRLKAYDGEDMDENVKTLLEDFPVDVEVKQPEAPELGGKTKGGGTEKTMEEMQAEMDAIAGLK